MDTLENYNTYKANNRHQHPRYVRSSAYTTPDSYSPIILFLDLYKLSRLTTLDHFPGRNKHAHEQWQIWKMSNISKTHYKFYFCRIHSLLTKLVEGGSIDSPYSSNLTKVMPQFTLSHRGSDNSPLLIVFSANYIDQSYRDFHSTEVVPEVLLFRLDRLEARGNTKD